MQLHRILSYLIRAIFSYLCLIGKTYALSPREQQQLATIGLWGLVASILVIAAGGILNALASRRRGYRSPRGPQAIKRKKRSKLPQFSYRKFHRRRRPKA
ncbi:MAG: hypothetical protein DRN81_04040 [Thermoproteota archaeon]|nr:MAG: hypothetical protein DRN81_04040 [Candidatus Korarchaeota archaeon]